MNEMVETLVSQVLLRMPKLGSVEPVENLRVRVTWDVGPRTNRSPEVVDLSSLIGSLKFYRPLRDNAQLFRSVHLIDNGSAIAWGDDAIDMAATSVERLAEESMSAADFREFLSKNNLTHGEAAAVLGRGRRQIEHYLSGTPIPRAVVLACFGYLARKQRAQALADLTRASQLYNFASTTGPIIGRVESLADAA